MKLVRFGTGGREKPGLLADDTLFDLSTHFNDWNADFFANNGLASLADLLDHGPSLPQVSADRLGPCIARPGKIIGIGLNYRDHAAETGAATPAEPIVFMKAANTVVGPQDPIVIPRGSTCTDWEVELGVVIGREARYLESAEEALDYVAGYCVSHDVSERAYQKKRGGQWTKGKSCDSFNPLGPMLVTADQVPDPQNLALRLSVNGTVRQNSRTSEMIFSVAYLIHYLSQFMTLEPGDLINTGTPHGVGMGMKPPTYLTAGDEVVLSVEGLGEQRSTCLQA